MSDKTALKILMGLGDSVTVRVVGIHSDEIRYSLLYSDSWKHYPIRMSNHSIPISYSTATHVRMLSASARSLTRIARNAIERS